MDEHEEETAVVAAFNARRGNRPRRITLELGDAACWLAAYSHYKLKGADERADALLRAEQNSDETGTPLEDACRAFIEREFTAALGAALVSVARGHHPLIGRGALQPEPYPYEPPPDDDFDGDIPF